MMVDTAPALVADHPYPFIRLMSPPTIALGIDHRQSQMP